MLLLLALLSGHCGHSSRELGGSDSYMERRTIRIGNKNEIGLSSPSADSAAQAGVVGRLIVPPLGRPGAGIRTVLRDLLSKELIIFRTPVLTRLRR